MKGKKGKTAQLIMEQKYIIVDLLKRKAKLRNESLLLSLLVGH